MAKAIGGIIGGTIGAVGGFLLGGPMGAIMGASGGFAAGSDIQGAIAANQQAATQESAVGSSGAYTGGGAFFNKVMGSLPSSGTGAGQTTTINGQTVSTEYALAQQTMQQQQAQTAAYEQMGLEKIGGMKVSEAGAESAIRAGAAARGFNIGAGTPQSELRSQKEAGAIQIGTAQQQLSSNIAEQKAATQTGYQRFRTAAALKDYSLMTQASNAWISAFGNIGATGATMMSNWYPSLMSQPNAAASSFSYPALGSYGYGW